MQFSLVFCNGQSLKVLFFVPLIILGLVRVRHYVRQVSETLYVVISLLMSLGIK